MLGHPDDTSDNPEHYDMTHLEDMPILNLKELY
jgi:hypothetical protein